MPTNSKYRFNLGVRYRPEDHERQRRLTPPYLLEPIRQLLGGIELDPCTEPDNPTGAAHYYTPPQDGCEMPWDAATVFCNPPYGKARNRWVDKCIHESDHAKIVLLMPSHTETQVSQRAMQAATSILFVRCRMCFGIPSRGTGQLEQASHGSVLYGFGINLAPMAECGVVLYRQNDGSQRRSEPPLASEYRTTGDGSLRSLD